MSGADVQGQGEHGARDEPVDAGVGRVVPVGVTRDEAQADDGAPHAEDGDGGDPDLQQPSGGRVTQSQDEKQGPEHVELGLDRQRPQVPVPSGVATQRVEDVVEDPQENGHGVDAHLVQHVGFEDEPDEDATEQIGADGGNEPEGAARPEADEVEVSRLGHFSEHQRGDEKPGEDEEQVDADESAGQEVCMDEEDDRDGDRADPVQARYTGRTAPTRLWRCRPWCPDVPCAHGVSPRTTPGDGSIGPN